MTACCTTPVPPVRERLCQFSSAPPNFILLSLVVGTDRDFGMCDLRNMHGSGQGTTRSPQSSVTAEKVSRFQNLYTRSGERGKTGTTLRPIPQLGRDTAHIGVDDDDDDYNSNSDTGNFSSNILTRKTILSTRSASSQALIAEL